MALPLERLPFEVLRELRRYRWAAVGLFALVSFAVLGVGFIYPYEYRSESVVYVDDNNIIRPLMEGSAEVTGISNQTSAARELLYSRRVLERIFEADNIFEGDPNSYSTERLEALYSSLRSNISVHPQGDNYFSIRYESTDPRESFLIARKLSQLFLEETSRRKREESQSAFNFIDKQVKSYEQQITRTEQELSEFMARNVEGTEESVQAEIRSIRTQIDDAELELEEARAQERSLRAQIRSLPVTMSSGGGGSAQAGGLAQRIHRMEQRLDELQLRYEDSYPDVINLKRQIRELKQRQEQVQTADPGTIEEDSDTGDRMFNPVYQEIRTQLSSTETRQESLQTRINALQRRMGQLEQRMARVQENKAERSDLTRDLQVNKEIYNDLLKRRERARVSMSLDVQGQGLSYQIHEQARYPLNPSGLQFTTFASVGWLLGLMAPIGLLVGLLQVDPRVRSVKQIQNELAIPLLGSIPVVHTPFEHRRERRGYLFMVVIVLLIGAGYLGVVFLQATGVLG